LTERPKHDRPEKTPKLESDRHWDAFSHARAINLPLDTDGGEVVPCLIVISGRQMGQVFQITARESSIGRADDADLRIRDASISRHHAAVYLDGESRCRVRDLGSTTGTFVNGCRIQDAELTAGDRIQLGRQTILKLEYHRRFEKEVCAQPSEKGTRDPLTDTFNRRYLDQHLEAGFRLATRHKEELSVLVVDVDRFEQVKDNHGHLAGDSVLRGIARVLGDRLRNEDIVARRRGEEFVLVLRRTGRKGALALAEAVRSLVESAEFAYRSKSIKVTVSIGVATLVHPPACANGLGLLAAADDALTRAKSGGRNRVVVAPNEAIG
jgi:diguanylate cyclase (GGDEF)-like protein